MKDDAATVTDEAIVAGTGVLVISPEAGVSQAHTRLPVHIIRQHTSPTRRARFPRSSARQLTSGLCEDYPLGDANADCVFDVEDVQYLQYYVGGQEAAYSERQYAAMDPVKFAR